MLGRIIVCELYMTGNDDIAGHIVELCCFTYLSNRNAKYMHYSLYETTGAIYIFVLSAKQKYILHQVNLVFF